MSKYAVSDEPIPGRVRNLSPEDATEADAAILDGKKRMIDLVTVVYDDEGEVKETIDNSPAVDAIGRYVSKAGFAMRSSVQDGKIHWIVVPKREMSEEHKTKLLANAKEAREAKKAALAQSQDETVAEVEPLANRGQRRAS